MKFDTYSHMDASKSTGTYDTFEAALAATIGGKPGLIAANDKWGWVTLWHKSNKGRLSVSFHRYWQGQGDWVTGLWSAAPLPDSDDDSSHAVENCACGDWEEGDIDERCSAKLESEIDFHHALLLDDHGHGYGFVRWLTQAEIDLFHLTGTAHPEMDNASDHERTE